MILIPESEYTIGAIPRALAQTAVAYELSRELVMVERDVRGKLDRYKSDKQVWREGNGQIWLEDIVAQFRQALGLVTFKDALDCKLHYFSLPELFVPLSHPEWPDRPFLDIPEREQRLQLCIPPKFTDAEMAQFVTHTPPWPGTIPVVLNIPDCFTPEIILRCVEALLKVKRIGALLPALRGGRAESPTALQDTLFVITVHRLWRTGMPRREIIELIQDSSGVLRYTSERALSKPLTKAKAKIEECRIYMTQNLQKVWAILPLLLHYRRRSPGLPES
jgi:hypothetical protein